MDQILKLFNESELKEYGEGLRLLFLARVTQKIQEKLGDDSPMLITYLERNDSEALEYLIKHHDIDLEQIARNVIQDLSRDLGKKISDEFSEDDIINK